MAKDILVEIGLEELPARLSMMQKNSCFRIRKRGLKNSALIMKQSLLFQRHADLQSKSAEWLNHSNLSGKK